MMSRKLNAETCSSPCKVLLDGIEQQKVYELRLGSNGWIKQYASPLRVNSKQEAARLPIKRGNVEIVPL